uniref:Uncharacterized protein n=1 Tax=Opuntia streptacantha TaxID=393608 RepID=A0A7C9ETH9_OPUST
MLDDPLKYHSPSPSDISAAYISLDPQILHILCKHSHLLLNLFNPQLHSLFSDGKISIFQQGFDLDFEPINQNPNAIQILDSNISAHLHCVDQLLLTLQCILIVFPKGVNPLTH